MINCWHSIVNGGREEKSDKLESQSEQGYKVRMVTVAGFAAV